MAARGSAAGPVRREPRHPVAGRKAERPAGEAPAGQNGAIRASADIQVHSMCLNSRVLSNNNKTTPSLVIFGGCFGREPSYFLNGN